MLELRQHSQAIKISIFKISLVGRIESLDIIEKMFDELGVRYIRSNTNFSFFETGIPVNELNKELLKYDIASEDHSLHSQNGRESVWIDQSTCVTMSKYLKSYLVKE